MKVVEMRTNSEGLTAYSGEFSFSAGSIEGEKKLNLQSDTIYLGVLLPAPKGYRLLTEEEKAKYDKRDLYKDVMYASASDGVFCCYRHLIPSKPWDHNHIYVIREDWKPEPKIDVTVTINGKAVDPSTISEETWNNLRKGGVE